MTRQGVYLSAAASEQQQVYTRQTASGIMSGYLMESFQLRDDQELVQAIRKQNVNKSVELLVNGANPNVANSDGDYPIHVAVQVHNVTLVKLLIIFYADLSVKNTAGETPYQLAVSIGEKAKDCAIAIKTITDLDGGKASTTS